MTFYTVNTKTFILNVKESRLSSTFFKSQKDLKYSSIFGHGVTIDLDIKI